MILTSTKKMGNDTPTWTRCPDQFWVNNVREGEGVEHPQTQEKYFRHMQRRDEYCEDIMHRIENDQENRRDIGRKKRKKIEQEEEFLVRDGLLHDIWQEREREERKFQ